MSHLPQGDQAPKRHRKLKISLVIIGVLVVLALGGLGNFLFDFALNPHASYTMKQMQDSEAEDEPQQTYAEEDAALSWFEKKGVPCSMTADDGTPLAGYYFAQKGQSGVASQMDVQNASGQDTAGERGSQHEYAICLHGYTNDPQSMALYVKRFYDRGMTVLAPAARAHAGSGGDYIGMGWPERLDVVKWIEAIVSRDPEARILVFGESMGAATAMNVAGEELPSQVKCIIEDCGYTSVWDEFSVQLADVFGLPSFPLLDVANVVCNLRAGYDFHAASSLEQLKKAEVPMLFIHGDADTFVPYSMLDQNFDACASKVKQKLVVEGAAHARSAQVDPELYWNTVDKFLDKNF
ncbi:MAG: alpha/beta hydrolase [Coriobacteriia bacterium]|nr:alpha/beta hydrolase [Coriobacteriia bacterium]